MSAEVAGIDPAKNAPACPTFKKFLEEASGHEQEVTATVKFSSAYNHWSLSMPSLSLYCASDACDDFVFFDPQDDTITLDRNQTGSPMARLAFAQYQCRHCKDSQKIFALLLKTSGGAVRTIRAMKFGEDPPAVGPTPRSLRTLLGGQWELFLQARRSEINGLGIGAFVYYRRVVEHVWQHALDRLIEVARIDGSADRIAALTNAQQEARFTRSMEAAAGAIPPSLYVDGHNPFQALYDACGDGLHEYSDEECLNRSRIIRLVLGRFADRAKSVLSEDREFRQALGALAAGK